MPGRCTATRSSGGSFFSPLPVLRSFSEGGRGVVSLAKPRGASPLFRGLPAFTGEGCLHPPALKCHLPKGRKASPGEVPNQKLNHPRASAGELDSVLLPVKVAREWIKVLPNTPSAISRLCPGQSSLRFETSVLPPNANGRM